MDLLGLDESDQNYDPFLFSHGKMSELYVFNRQSTNPLLYRAEAEKLKAEGRNPPTDKGTCYSDYIYCCERYKQLPTNPVFVGMAIQSIQRMRANALYFDVVALNGEFPGTVRGEVIKATPAGDQIALWIPPQPGSTLDTMAWFDLDFGHVLNPSPKKAYELAF